MSSVAGLRSPSDGHLFVQIVSKLIGICGPDVKVSHQSDVFIPAQGYRVVFVVHDDGVRYVEICSPGIGLQGAWVTLYDPTDPRLFDRALSDATFGAINLQDLYSGLGMSVEDFYLNFSDPSLNTCLAEPANYVPE